MIDIAENVKTNSIPYRTSNGTIKATDPQEDDDAATKLYVDRYIKPSNIYADDNLLDICNAADDTLASIPFKTINGISLFGESGDIEVEAPTFISTFNISSKNITQAINGVYRTNLSNSNLVTFLRKQEGTLTTTINLLETPKFTWDITLLPAQYLQKKSSGTTYAFVGSTIVPEDLSAYGGNATANLVILRCEALYYNDVVYSYYLTIIPIEASGGTVIEKTCDNNGTFAADLTADEFTQLSTNAASLKLTYNYLNTLPITLYLSNPVVGTLDGTTTTIVYQFPVPLTVDGVWMAVINSGDLTKIDLTHKVQDTTPAYGSDGGYTAISNYPLLGLVHDEADVATLLTPTAFEFGNLYYKTDTTSWQWSGNTDHIGDNYITATIMSLNGATQTSIAGTAFEAMLMMTQTDGSYKYYTSIVNIGNDNVSGSEGLFTVYDTTTHKPIYITFTIKANSSTTLTVDTFTAYQDGAAATDAVLPLVYGIKLFRL